MISLEQVKLLESKVTKAIDYVKTVTEENFRLKGKLDSYQKRIDELEVLIQQFKEEQGKIEDGILSALDRLNQFEDALESTLAKGELRGETKEAKKDSPVQAQGAPKKDDREEKTASSSTKKPDPPREPEQSEDLKSGEELDIF